jgi:hypothetical protein
MLFVAVLNVGSQMTVLTNAVTSRQRRSSVQYRTLAGTLLKRSLIFELRKTSAMTSEQGQLSPQPLKLI